MVARKMSLPTLCVKRGKKMTIFNEREQAFETNFKMEEDLEAAAREK